MRYIFIIAITLGTLLLINQRDTIEMFSHMEDVLNKNNAAAVQVSPINIDYLRSQKFEGSDIEIEEELAPGSNYNRYIASYKSDGYKIYGLLTVPTEEMPEGGYSAIVFNHGYIPPNQYETTEKYVAYVDYLARSGFVVFKIDLRGHGDSEGTPSGSYFSSAYTIDAINALKSLQKLDYVNSEKIGIWGHSMAGNLTLRAMEVETDFKAGVIWAGAVYSYLDFAEYRLNDSSYVRQPDSVSSQPQDSPINSDSTGENSEHFVPPETGDTTQLDLQRRADRDASDQIRKLRTAAEEVDFNDDFWTGVSLTKNLKYLNAPVQLHHAVNDFVVNIGYSRDLIKEADTEGKNIELFEYEGGGHNIESPYFETAMQRTVEFFNENL